MNTEQMKYLIEVSQHNSMTAASEKLFMTSQALSIAIKKMEDELGGIYDNYMCTAFNEPVLDIIKKSIVIGE